MIITDKPRETQELGTTNSIRCLVSTADHMVARKSLLRRSLSGSPTRTRRKKVVISPYIKVFGERSNDYYYDRNIGLHGGRSQSFCTSADAIASAIEPSPRAFDLQRIHTIKEISALCSSSLDHSDTPRPNKSTGKAEKKRENSKHDQGRDNDKANQAEKASGTSPPPASHGCPVSAAELARIHMMRQQQKAFREQSDRLSKKFDTIKTRTERRTAYSRSYRQGKFIRYGSPEVPIGWESDEDFSVLDLSIKTI